MPELPEVQTTATSLAPLLGQRLQRVEVFTPKLRWAIAKDLTRLHEHTLSDVQRRAKYLILTFTPSQTSPPTPAKQLLVHLGMSGSLQQHPAGFAKRKHDHVIWHFIQTNGACSQLHYHDPRRFGMVLWLNDYRDKLLTPLGIEPLDAAFDGAYLWHVIHGGKRPSARPIKSVMMNQRVVVGVGNIYATEALFVTRIHPLTPANRLTLTQLEALAAQIQAILRAAIAKGGSTLRDFTVADGKTGYFQQTLHVYGKVGAPCPVCQTTIEQVKIEQRTSAFCPHCQPLEA